MKLKAEKQERKIMKPKVGTLKISIKLISLYPS